MAAVDYPQLEVLQVMSSICKSNSGLLANTLTWTLLCACFL